MSDTDVELYRKHRPLQFAGLLGQGEALTMLKSMGPDKFPHALLFTGPSGCGKTTAARILRTKLGCGDADFFEINSADNRGIDEARKLIAYLGLMPRAGKCKVYLIDEVHKMTTDAQNAMLKVLEDTPPHCYFILASSEPAKLIKAIKTRCTEIKFKAVAANLLAKLVTETAKLEKKEVGENVAKKIAEYAEGSPRKALVLLHQCLGMPDDATRLKSLEKPEMQASGFEIAQALVQRKDWKEISVLLKKAEDEEAEGIRRIILGYCKSCLLGKIDDRIWNIMLCFKEPTYNWGPGAEWHALVTCCYEAAVKV